MGWIIAILVVVAGENWFDVPFVAAPKGEPS